MEVAMGRRSVWILGAVLVVMLCAAPARAQVHVAVGVGTPVVGASVVVGAPYYVPYAAPYPYYYGPYPYYYAPYPYPYAYAVPYGRVYYPARPYYYGGGRAYYGSAPYYRGGSPNYYRGGVAVSRGAHVVAHGNGHGGNGHGGGNHSRGR
jgi:hypothetical protein